MPVLRAWETVPLAAVEVGDLVREHSGARPWRVQRVVVRYAPITRHLAAQQVVLHAVDHQHASHPKATIERVVR